MEEEIDQITYQVQESDLIGDLEGYPIEIVQKMVDYQIKQTNKADVKVFIHTKNAGLKGGFDWKKTVEGFDFWNDVLHHENFDLFFGKYPKEGHEVVIKDVVTIEQIIKEFEFINNELELDFGGQMAVKFKITEKGIVVVRAMNGNGENITESVGYYGMHKVLHGIEDKVGGKITHCHLDNNNL